MFYLATLSLWNIHSCRSLQRVLHSVLSARLLLNLREASLGSTVLVDGEPINESTVQLSNMRFTLAPNRKPTVGLFSIDDGAWVSGDAGTRIEHESERGMEMDLELHNQAHDV